MVRIITKKPATLRIEAFKKEGYGVTSIETEGVSGKVHIIFTVVRRNRVDDVITLIRQYHPNAFYTIEDIRTIEGGNFPGLGCSERVNWSWMFWSIRKGK